MIEMISLVNSKLNDFVWGVPAMVLILGVGETTAHKSKIIPAIPANVVTAFFLLKVCFM